MINKFGSLGCLVVAGGLAIGFNSPAAAQANAGSTAKPAASKSSDDDDNYNKYWVGAFAGVQLWHLETGNASGNNDHLADGVAVGIRADQDVMRHLGFEESWVFWAENNLKLTPFPAYPTTEVGLGSKNGQVYIGPLLYLAPPSSKVRPFLTIGPEFEYFVPTFAATRQVHDVAAYDAQTLQTKYGPALGFGGGIKFRASDNMNFRIDARGTYTENPHYGLLSTPNTPGNLWIPTGDGQLGVLLTVGLDWGWGRHPAPPPPATKLCHGKQIPVDEPCPNLRISVSSVSADHSSVCAGEPVNVTAVIDAPDGATYQWTVNGDPAGHDKSMVFDTKGRPAGSYTIALTVSAPEYDNGTGSTSVAVQAYVPPTGTLTANPSEIWVTETSALSVTTSNQCGGPVRVEGYSASEGTVSGTTYDSSSVQFDPANRGEQRKPVTVTAKLRDDQGTGSASTSIIVKKKHNPAPAAHLTDLVFGRDNARVNNCAKRVLLEELKTYRDSDPNGKVILVGHFDKGEMKKMHLDEKRAMNSAAVLTAGSGICANFNPSQVLVQSVGEDQSTELKARFCESSVKETKAGMISAKDKRAQYRRVEVWWVPSEAEVPASAASAKDASSLGVSKLGCPK